MTAKLRKFVKVKSFTAKTDVGVGFNVLRRAINRTGTTLDNVGESVYTQKTLQKFQADYLSDSFVKQITIVKKGTKQKNTFFKDFNKRLKRMFRVKKRQKAEDAAERGIKEGNKESDKLISKIGKPIKKTLGFFSDTLGTIIKYFAMFGALKWITQGDNAEKLAKLGRLVIAMGKFAFKIVEFGVGGVLSGLTNLVGDLSDKNMVERGMRRFLGVFQLIGGLAALRTAQYLVMPWKLLKDVKAINGIFTKTAMTTEEVKASQKARLNGYRDKKTGVIYSEKEYKAMKNSARRADAKRARNAGKGMKSDLYSNQFDDRFKKNYSPQRKTRLQRLQQKGRIAKGKTLRGVGRFAKANPAKVTGALSVLGGGLRIASGLAGGEEAGQAIGAGIGQAAGGIAGAAALTAVAPFLGPFAPMIGSAIGGFLGEWVGKTFGKIAQPIFEPIGRAFKMYFKLAMDITKPFRENLGPLLGALFEVIGGIGQMIFKGLQPLLDFTGFVLKLAGGVLADTIAAVINNVKRLLNPKSVIAGIADAVTFNAFDFDRMQSEEGSKAWWDPAGVFTGKDKKDEKAEGGFVEANFLDGISKSSNYVIPKFDKGGEYSMGYRMGQIFPDQLVYSYEKFLSKSTQTLRNNELVKETNSEEFIEYGGSIGIDDLIEHRKQLLSHPLLKSFKIADIINGTTGLTPEVLYPILMNSDAQKATNKKIEEAIKADVKKMEKKFGKGNGWSWVDESFSKGGEIEKVGKWVMNTPHVKAIKNLTKLVVPQEERREKFMNALSNSISKVKDTARNVVTSGFDRVRDYIIEPATSTQARIVKGESNILAKAQRDADEELETELLVITQNITQPVINTISSTPPKFVYINSKSPMLTEFT